ncbi:TylF/MycF/NovP-related O-methyltransferase [Limisalsivibrio acetivorans]|uniref:TylF/MycF/NovP-related O-methyltransferase n=1 Tax=Limisalsivibrio acetivorans TaxID=1304888 RepID=UPI0003B45A40|nr:TylF/MycF/NovP-related O-methyltransferase [Limisalsivibrio acetivorans]
MPGKNKLTKENPFATNREAEAVEDYQRIFESSEDDTKTKLRHFPKYVRRQDMTKFLARYEIFKRVLNVKGSIIECGVFKGFGMFSWGHFSEILEPNNLTRRIYGFDTFEGFPTISEQDKTSLGTPEKGDLASHALEELEDLKGAFDKNRFLGHMEKMRFVPGKAEESIPKFLEENPHTVVSLLFMDFDLYEPTKVALEHFVPRMPKGSVIAFDELDNPLWPGETLALLDSIGINNLRLERCDFDPYVGFAVID